MSPAKPQHIRKGDPTPRARLRSSSKSPGSISSADVSYHIVLHSVAILRAGRRERSILYVASWDVDENAAIVSGTTVVRYR